MHYLFFFEGRCVLKERTEDNIEYSLPYGWTKIGQRRQGDQDRWDVYLITPCGKKLRSNLEVDRYLEKCPDVDCDREVTNTSKPWADSTPAKPKPKRVRIAKSPDINYHGKNYFLILSGLLHGQYFQSLTVFTSFLLIT